MAIVLFTSTSPQSWNRPLVSTVTLLEARSLNQSDGGAICQRAGLRVADNDDFSRLCPGSRHSVAFVSVSKGKNGSDGGGSRA